jgi:hypothetical protein
MAVSTASDWEAGVNVIAPYRYTKIGSGSDSIGTLFGAPIPPNVTAVTIQHDAATYQHKIRWRVRSDISDEIHEMELPDAATREHIQAVLTAMRLTC